MGREGSVGHGVQQFGGDGVKTDDLTKKERQIIEFIRKWRDDNKYGNIQINFNSGGMTNVNLNESVRLSE